MQDMRFGFYIRKCGLILRSNSLLAFNNSWWLWFSLIPANVLVSICEPTISSPFLYYPLSSVWWGFTSDQNSACLYCLCGDDQFCNIFLSFCLFWCIKYLVILSQMKENGNVYYLDDFLIKLISVGNQQIILIIFVVVRHECILLFESRQRIQPRDQWDQESCLWPTLLE